MSGEPDIYRSTVAFKVVGVQVGERCAVNGLIDTLA